MDEKRNIRKELLKIDIDYDNLTEKEKSMLDLADEWMEKKFEYSKKKIHEIRKYDYSIRDFCIECNINRATLYKKNSEGKNNYEVVIQFINSRGSEIKELTQRLIEKPRKENNNDINEKIRKLVMRDVEYMKLQDRLKELEKKIKSLEKENKELIKKQGMA